MGEATTVYIMSDSLGETAASVADAALGQFESSVFQLVRMPKVRSASRLEELVAQACRERCVIFYTFAKESLRHEMRRVIAKSGVRAVDVLSPGVEALMAATGMQPTQKVGTIRAVGEEYFERIASLEFAVEHDDGRHPEDLGDADIVLIGVSRTSKTPLSMYLAYKGYKVANVPLVPGIDPPQELFRIDPGKVFGLVYDPSLLSEIRGRRVAELGGYMRGYAELRAVEDELRSARQLMRRIGALVINTSNKAIEESAQEVLRHLEK